MIFSYAIVVPMANEEDDFEAFVAVLREALDRIGSGAVYFVVDGVSKDATRRLCEELSAADERFVTVWAPENRNVVDAYLRGYREAYAGGYEYIIEMDGGLSHDPRALPMFLRVLNEGNECAFGSRFMNGGSICDSNPRRTFLSRSGTILSNVLLGTKLHDMTSGYQGFHRSVVASFMNYPLLSKAHFTRQSYATCCVRRAMRRCPSITVLPRLASRGTPSATPLPSSSTTSFDAFVFN